MLEHLKRLKTRLKAAFERYGSTAVLVWFAIFALVWSSFYLLLTFGLDVPTLASDWGLTVEEKYLTAGTALLAYGCTQVTKPLRILLTLALTPRCATFLEQRRADRATPKI